MLQLLETEFCLMMKVSFECMLLWSAIMNKAFLYVDITSNYNYNYKLTLQVYKLSV